MLHTLYIAACTIGGLRSWQPRPGPAALDSVAAPAPSGPRRLESDASSVAITEVEMLSHGGAVCRRATQSRRWVSRAATGPIRKRTPRTAPGRTPELGEQVCHVRLDRGLADEDLGGDLGVRQTAPSSGVPRPLALSGESVPASVCEARPAAGAGTPGSGAGLPTAPARSPRCERLPATSCSGGTPLTRKPLAPARRAS
jgi:hypothetical protein